MALEHPGRFGLLHLPAGTDAGRLFAALAVDEPETAVLDSEVCVPRLVRTTPDAGERRPRDRRPVSAPAPCC